jgi:ABC-type uncharacterized transport system ATPase subunit
VVFATNDKLTGIVSSANKHPKSIIFVTHTMNRAWNVSRSSQ